MSSAPNVCECRFCGKKCEPRGIANHERWCDENPERGMDPDRAEELGLLDDAQESTPDPLSPGESAGEFPSVEAHPDQSVSTDGGSLPPRESVPEPNKSTSDAQNVPEVGEETRCPACGSDNTMPTSEAEREFEQRMERVPDGLRRTLARTETYCNSCFSVSGGDLSEPYSIAGGEA